MAQENIFQNVLEGMQKSLSQLEGGEADIKPTDDFVLKNFWIKICLCSKSVHAEATKLCMLFSKPPVPVGEAAVGVLRAVEEAYTGLLSIFYTLPKECGLTLRTEVQRALIDLLKALIAVVKCISTGNYEEDDVLKLAGWVWESCKVVEALPNDNLAAVSGQVQREEALVQDALQEIEEELKNDKVRLSTGSSDVLDNTECWSNQDRELLPPCVGLVKTACACLRRTAKALTTQGKHETDQQVAQLDDLAAAIARLSPVVDDFVSSVYAPMDKESVKSAAVKVVTEVRSLLQIVRHSHYAQEDLGWVDFLGRAVAHNNNNLQPLLS